MDHAHMMDVVQSVCLVGLPHGLQFDIQNVCAEFCVCFGVICTEEPRSSFPTICLGWVFGWLTCSFPFC